MKVLGFLFYFTTIFSVSIAHADNPPPPSEPANPCVDIASALDTAYQTLYNVDTRPLTFDNYKLYRDSIENVHGQTEALKEFCKQPVVTPIEQVLYRTKDLSWQSGVSNENPCASADFTSVRKEFEETSARECFRDGYLDCKLKSPSRAFAISGSRNENYTWKCVAKLDLLLDARK